MGHDAGDVVGVAEEVGGVDAEGAVTAAIGAEEGDPHPETVVRENHPLLLVVHADAHVELGPGVAHCVGEQDLLRSLKTND